MKNVFKLFVVFSITVTILSSCTSISKTMRGPNTVVELNKNDFSLSEQVTAEAQTIKIVGIDFARLFMKKGGIIEGGGSANINLVSIPIFGNMITDRTASYSMYELMNQNPGYDVIFYPQCETKILKPILGIGFLTKITTVKTTARLGKMNK